MSISSPGLANVFWCWLLPLHRRLRGALDLAGVGFSSLCQTVVVAGLPRRSHRAAGRLARRGVTAFLDARIVTSLDRFGRNRVAAAVAFGFAGVVCAATGRALLEAFFRCGLWSGVAARFLANIGGSTFLDASVVAIGITGGGAAGFCACLWCEALLETSGVAVVCVGRDVGAFGFALVLCGTTLQTDVVTVCWLGWGAGFFALVLCGAFLQTGVVTISGIGSGWGTGLLTDVRCATFFEASVVTVGGVGSGLLFGAITNGFAAIGPCSLPNTEVVTGFVFLLGVVADGFALNSRDALVLAFCKTLCSFGLFFGAANALALGFGAAFFQAEIVARIGSRTLRRFFPRAFGATLI